jgi:hypothetical protein
MISRRYSIHAQTSNTETKYVRSAAREIVNFTNKIS